MQSFCYDDRLSNFICFNHLGKSIKLFRAIEIDKANEKLHIISFKPITNVGSEYLISIQIINP